MKRIGIVYLSFHCEPYIDDVVKALEKVSYPRELLEFIIVDNPHPQHGSSVPYLTEKVLPKSKLTLPNITILPQTENLGFAKGNNVGAKWAKEHGCDFIFFLNNDAYPSSNVFEPLIKAFEDDQKIGIAQSFLLLHPETDLINTSGNAIHFLGFGYCRDYRVPVKDRQFKEIEKIPYASGAGFMIPSQLFDSFGGWDEDFFLYHEDMEWSLRLKSLGYKVVMVRDSVVYHAYEFQRSISKFYWMERNRFGVWLMFFKYKTLLLMLPAMFVYEIGIYFFALIGGWAKEKNKVYSYWLNTATIKMWLKKRERIQQIRSMPDKELVKDFVGFIAFQEARFSNSVLKYVANPIMSAYWFVVKRIILW